MSQTNGKKAKTPKLDNTEDFWTKLNAELSGKDIEKLHQQVIKDLEYDPNDVKPVGHEKW